MIEKSIIRRWQSGRPHHPETQSLFASLRAIDEEWGGNFFNWKSGGDGDNGEHLMYEMDIHFESMDELRREGLL